MKGLDELLESVFEGRNLCSCFFNWHLKYPQTGNAGITRCLFNSITNMIHFSKCHGLIEAWISYKPSLPPHLYTIPLLFPITDLYKASLSTQDVLGAISGGY